jgi:dienelactone hydrolase
MSDSQPAPASRAVFLSYASQDADAARRLCDALRAAGIEVWFDQNELVGGDAWDAKIRKQIAACALFVPMISATTQARAEGYFRREWKLAVERTRDMADHVAFLLPVVLDGTTDREAHVPEKFREVQWTRVRTAEAEAAFVQRVAQLVGVGSPSATVRDQPAPQSVVASPAPLRAGATPPPRKKAPPLRRWLLAVAVTVALAAGATLVWSWQRSAALRREQAQLLPEIERLLAARQVGAAFDLATAAERAVPDDPALKALWPRLACITSIDTNPAGAAVYVKEYYQPQSAWRYLGKTPLAGVRLPRVYARWKIEKEGCAPLDRALGVDAPVHFDLDPASAVPAGMVKVGAGSLISMLTGLNSVTLGDFFIDRYEVTNRQFRAFVEQKGYQNRAYWKQPFVRQGQPVEAGVALAEFHDRTGQPGPATWKDGTYPADQADFPVTGICWYEAAAYAEFAGKRLPSIYHWRVAAQVAEYESLVPLSNFSGRSLARVGTFQGMSTWGAYDLAGNAKEWCWNEGGGGTRYVLGGAWREGSYMFSQRDAQSPFDRSAEYGFRCMRLIGPGALPEAVDAELAVQLRNYAEERPVSDEVYQAFRSAYFYDKTPLDVRLEGVDDADPRWRLEKISFRAAYGNERVPAHLFLPKNSTPPYQTVLYYPTSAALTFKSLTEYPHDLAMIAMVVASGRAVICPIYKGTFDRYEKWPAGAALSAYRDMMVMVAKDLGRTIDYLETRPDVQPGKLAFFGYSAGGTAGTILPAVEPRLKASVLVAAGFTQGKSLPEADPINFAPRNTVPTLMLNGRYDFARPVELSQAPMFRLLGAPAEQKRHVLFDTGHTLKPEQIASEVYVWLDRYLGLVK